MNYITYIFKYGDRFHCIILKSHIELKIIVIYRKIELKVTF